MRQWRQLMVAAEASPTVFVAPVLLMLLASAFEGLTVALLVPTLEGLIAGDFSRAADLPLLGPVLKGPLGDLASGDQAVVLVLMGALAGAVLLKLAAAFQARLMLARASTALADALRRRLFARYLGFGKRFFDDNNAGHLHGVLLGHTTTLGSSATTFGVALNLVFTIVVFVALMLFLSWQLTLVAGALFPLLYLSLSGLLRRIEEQSDQAFVAQRRLHELTFNLIACVPLVKAYCRESREVERFGGMSAEVARIDLDQRLRLLFVGPAHELLVLGFVAVLILFVAKVRPETPANILVFFYVLKRTSTYVNELNHHRADLAKLSGSLRVVLDGLVGGDKPVVPDGAREFPGLRDRLDVDRLTFSYGSGGPPVLSDVSFSVRRGTTTAVVGRTGSGKSTLISLLMRFYDVGAGMIRLDGVDIREFTHESLRRHLALVPQDCQLFNATMRENLLYGLDRAVPEGELTEVLRSARLDELIERLPAGLDTEIGDRGVKLSGGEKQRLSLARALLKRADILLLDEATSSLDSRTERLVQEAIDACLAGRTAIVVAHRLATVQNADEVVLIEDGVLVERGPLKDLLDARGAFHAYWEAQRFDRSASPVS